MAINSISTIASTPWCGLGTQTYNVTVAGTYTVQVYAFPPWQTSDQPSSIANPQAFEVQTVTTVADTAGSLNSKYFTFWNPGNSQLFYVWYNIATLGVDPLVANAIGIPVAAATGATANTIATATRAAINANQSALVLASGATNQVILTAETPGAMTAAANGAASPVFTYSVGTVGSFGYASGLVITVNKNTTAQYVLGPPTPTQPLLAGATQFSVVAGDVITMVASSLATADLGLNAVKGIVNVFLGPI